MDIRRRFGDKIRALRRLRGWSQERLALESGLDRTYVGGLERGERNVALVNIDRLARSLGVSLTELFEELDDITNTVPKDRK